MCEGRTAWDLRSRDFLSLSMQDDDLSWRYGLFLCCRISVSKSFQSLYNMYFYFPGTNMNIFEIILGWQTVTNVLRLGICPYELLYCNLYFQSPTVADTRGAQWRIQEGAPTPQGGANIWFCQYFPKTSWNWKNLDPQGGARPKFYYVDPPLGPLGPISFIFTPMSWVGAPSGKSWIRHWLILKKYS